MAYTPANHQVWSQRIKNWVVGMQAQLEEANKLDLIYTNEGGNTGDPDYVDNANGTAAEHTDVVTMMRAYKDFIEGNAVATLNRQIVMSPFLQ